MDPSYTFLRQNQTKLFQVLQNDDALRHMLVDMVRMIPDIIDDPINKPTTP